MSIRKLVGWTACTNRDQEKNLTLFDLDLPGQHPNPKVECCDCSDCFCFFLLWLSMVLFFAIICCLLSLLQLFWKMCLIYIFIKDTDFMSMFRLLVRMMIRLQYCLLFMIMRLGKVATKSIIPWQTSKHQRGCWWCWSPINSAALWWSIISCRQKNPSCIV